MDDSSDARDTPPTPEQQLYDWLCSLFAQTPIITPTEPEPPWYPGVLSGPEHDITPVVHALAVIEQNPTLHPVWDALCQWIIAHNGHVRAGHDLCNDLGVAIGELEPPADVAAFESAPTDRIAHLVRTEWRPDHLADAATHAAAFAAAMIELYRMTVPEDFAALITRGSKVIDVADLAPPLTLAPDDADARPLPLPAPPGSARVEAVPSGVPVELSESAREPGAALAAALETVSAVGTPRAGVEAEDGASGVLTLGRWLAAAGIAVALAAALAVAMLPDDTTAEARPLPVSAVDYPTCPSPVERAAEPSEHADAPEPEPAPPAALPAAAAPTPPPIPPRRKVSTVKLTETKGVLIKQRGHADFVVLAREATADDADMYVIDADAQNVRGTGIVMPVDSWAVIVELGDEE